MQSFEASNQIQEEGIKVLSVDKLQEQFSNLQQDWEFFKKSNPRTRKTLVRSLFYSTTTTKCSYSSSSSTSNLVVKTLDLLDQSSPRNLMSCLQSNSKNNISTPHDHHRSMMITRTIDSDVREIARERKVAIESSSLKGRRRLFDQSCDSVGLVHDQDLHEVRSVVSFDESNGENDSFSGTGEIDHDSSTVWVRRYSCSLSGERSQVLKKEKKSSYNNGVLILFVVLIVVIFAICVIIRNVVQFDFGKSDVILVPT